MQFKNKLKNISASDIKLKDIILLSVAHDMKLKELHLGFQAGIISQKEIAEFLEIDLDKIFENKFGI